MRPVRLVRVAGSTALTTPRITAPAGTSVRPSITRSTSVVASKRSSTFVVPELSTFDRRTSSSVPAGISRLVEVRDGRSVDGAGAGAGSGGSGVPGAGVLVAVPAAVPRARLRTPSIRDSTSANSLRASVRSLRSFTRR